MQTALIAMSRLQHKKGRPSNYRRSLKNNAYWDKVKRAVRIRDNHKCRHCGKTYQLEIHHIKYYVNGKSIVGNELNHLDCLVTLCENCHQKEHKKNN